MAETFTNKINRLKMRRLADDFERMASETQATEDPLAGMTNFSRLSHPVGRRAFVLR